MEDGCRGTTSSRERSTSLEAWEWGGGWHTACPSGQDQISRDLGRVSGKRHRRSQSWGVSKSPAAHQGQPGCCPGPLGQGSCAALQKALPACRLRAPLWAGGPQRQASVGCWPVPCPPQGAQKAAGFCVFPGSAPPCCPGSCLDNESPDLESLSQRDLSRMLTAQDTVLPNKRCERVT